MWQPLDGGVESTLGEKTLASLEASFWSSLVQAAREWSAATEPRKSGAV